MFPLSTSIKSILKTNCTRCLRYQNYATRKRFYRGTGIVQSDSKWEVTLDHRRLKTPNGQVLAVNSEPLARAIAAEWDAQTEVIAQPVMHLTALCNIALDNPGKLTPHDIAIYFLEYISTDTLLFYSEEDEELRKLQEKEWGPVIEWFQKRFNVTQEVSRGLEPPPVTAETRAVLARYFLSYDFPALSAMSFGVEALKSPLLMIACVERRLEPKQAVFLARLEEEFQLMRWGRVPWAHELNQAELTARVAASLLVIHSSAENHSAKAKASPEQLSQ
uniref:ATP synthase mitochondrial F1 complex assembly factor 2 n=1 Tax=Heliothis virescens TaxID=7102 RepID=A0A2A4IY97_HELVI